MGSYKKRSYNGELRWGVKMGHYSQRLDIWLFITSPHNFPS